MFDEENAVRIPKWLTILAVGIAIAVWVGPKLFTLYTEWLWFASLDYQSVLWRIWSTKINLGLIFTVVFWGVLMANFLAVRRIAPEAGRGGIGEVVHLRTAVRQERLYRYAPWLALAVSVLMGWGATYLWEEFQQFIHATPFGLSDPQFGHDVGFYLFRLPLLKALFRSLFWLLLLSTGAVVALYLTATAVREWSDLTTLPPAARAHVSLLCAALFLVKAWGYWLNRYDLLYTSHGAVWGAGYTDVHARLPVLYALVGMALLCAGLLIFNLFARGFRLLIVGVGLLLLTSFLGGGIYPAIYQGLFVNPNEIEREAPYLERNIEFTRRAFGLDAIGEQPFPVNTDLTWEDLQADAPTVDNIRLWDRGPLRDTYRQLQEIRTYYEFAGIDIDRYWLNDEYVQVALAGRELSFAQLPSQAQTWVNRHLVYTHGYGLCLSPVNVFDREGQPVLFVKDIPPVATEKALQVTRPEIYYGELPPADDYVVVNLRESETTREFDYPRGDANVYTSYAGRGGVKVGGFFRRLAWALRFHSLNLLISQSLTPESRILLYRQVAARVRRLAPFLVLDSDPATFSEARPPHPDPYLVVAEGRLFWILDAYTAARTYPYSEPLPSRWHRYNYLRNSVKVVVDAYHGKVTFYAFDPEDPVLRTYRKIFPALFKDYAEMPSSLQVHIRYPHLLFYFQALMYQKYHMTDPRVFYNREDEWELPTEEYADKTRRMTPYYIIMRLPGEEREEFLLMVPFTPRGTKENPRNNMIAWLCARCDGENYGHLLVFRFPKQELVYGPMQIEARINQDPYISEQLTLWQQEGSRVIRGNLLVIPIKNSLLYVEPLYLTAERSALPELKRVIVAYGQKVVMETWMLL